MNLKETINADFMIAFKAKELGKKNFLGVVKGEIENEEGRGAVATDDVVLRILKKIEKSLAQTNTNESLAELEYLKPYLPVLMSNSEIEVIITDYYNNKGLSSFGEIMAEFNANYKGKANNFEVSGIVNKIIAG